MNGNPSRKYPYFDRLTLGTAGVILVYALFFSGYVQMVVPYPDSGARKLLGRYFIWERERLEHELRLPRQGQPTGKSEPSEVVVDWGEWHSDMIRLGVFGGISLWLARKRPSRYAAMTNAAVGGFVLLGAILSGIALLKATIGGSFLLGLRHFAVGLFVGGFGGLLSGWLCGGVLRKSSNARLQVAAGGSAAAPILVVVGTAAWAPSDLGMLFEEPSKAGLLLFPVLPLLIGIVWRALCKESKHGAHDAG